jgi:hypothetical protein
MLITSPVALFEMATLAPGITPPVLSVTVPTMLPVEMLVCAVALVEYKENAENSATANQNDRRATHETNDNYIVHSSFR